MLQFRVRAIQTQLKPGLPPNAGLAQELFAKGDIAGATQASKQQPDQVTVAAVGDGLSCTFSVEAEGAPRIGDIFVVKVEKVMELGALVESFIAEPLPDDFRPAEMEDRPQGL